MGSTDDEAGARRSIGPHLAWVEPPDILHTRIDGDITQDHVKELLDALTTFPQSRGIYILRDARGGGIPTREAREALVKGLPLDQIAAVISYGASFQARTLLTMLNHAMRVLRPRAPRFVFAETEAEARTFIAADRARRA